MDDLEALQPRADLVLDALEKRFYLTVEDNAAGAAFLENLGSDELTLTLRDGAFGKVASLPWDLPRDDAEITAAVGDVVLTEGGELAIVYDGAEGTMTRLARIHNAEKETLSSAFGEGETEVSFYLEWTE